MTKSSLLHTTVSLSLTAFLLLLVASSCSTTAAQQQDFQPRTIVTIEALPARRQLGSISMPEGSPWCDGKPTYWLVGHQGDYESPWCLVVSNSSSNSSSQSNDFSDYYDYSGSTWEMSTVAILDVTDELNSDGKRYIDRHDCAIMDVNQDNVPDVLCGIGADSGTGKRSMMLLLLLLFGLLQ